MAAPPPSPQGEPVIRACHRQDMADALVAYFLQNADAGEFEANDRFVNELGAWQRSQRAQHSSDGWRT